MQAIFVPVADRPECAAVLPAPRSETIGNLPVMGAGVRSLPGQRTFGAVSGYMFTKTDIPVLMQHT